MQLSPPRREPQGFADRLPRGDLPAASITFPNRDASGFVDAVKDRIAEYFEARGRSRHATAGMVLKTMILLAVFFVPYGLILSNRVAPLGMLGLAVVMGIGLAGSWS